MKLNIKLDEKKRNILIAIIVIAIIFLISRGTMAFFRWQTSEEQQTEVVFTIEKAFTCSADGGGNITSQDVAIMPTSCMDSAHAIKREVKVMPDIISPNTIINLDLYMDVNSLGTGLKNSQNFNYALTTSSTSCTEGVVASGNFNGKTSGNKIQLLDKDYSQTVTDPYYLYIWLDAAETSQSTMNQSFNLSLSGQCEEIDSISPEKPVLDSGMIPVKIANDGTVTTVSSTDSSWYDYSNKEWANVVLVDSNYRSTYLGTTGKTVNQSHILAYYTWIPRYSYKIPTKTCAEISSPTPVNHPECFAPYTMTDTDKETLISTTVDSFELDSTAATTAINTGLQTGMFNATINGSQSYFSLPGYIALLNSMGMEINYTSGTLVGSAITNGVKTIDISFESTESSTLTGDAINTYRTHPAFIWDGNTIAGIWVGKFETSTESTSTCYTSASTTNCNNTTQSPRILPNVSSLRYQSVSNKFQTSLKFAGGTLSDSTVTFAGSSRYGLTTNTDSHMMKNSEWGAVAYLSHSLYGINDEIRINNYWNNGSKTGCGASTANALESTSCEIAYAGASSYPQSTTGNITGIFDISGGSYEYVMGNYNDTVGSSEFTTLPTSKYYDKYTSSDILTACDGGICYGHALSETMTWYSDFVLMPNTTYPWFFRGGDTYNGASSGAFSAGDDSGGDGGSFSWRSVLVVG